MTISHQAALRFNRKLIEEAYPEKSFKDAELDEWVAALMRLPADDADLMAAADRLGDYDRWPTFRQIKRAIHEARLRPPVSDHEEHVAACVKRFGHKYLAIEAIPYDTVCESCAAKWVHFDADPSDALVEHIHVWDYPQLRAAGLLRESMVGPTPVLRIDGWTESTVTHAVRWAMRHLPSGKDGEYHPLRRTLSDEAWRALNESWQEARRAYRKSLPLEAAVQKVAAAATIEETPKTKRYSREELVSLGFLEA